MANSGSNSLRPRWGSGARGTLPQAVQGPVCLGQGQVSSRAPGQHPQKFPQGPDTLGLSDLLPGRASSWRALERSQEGTEAKSWSLL